jgi:hypothetical protein
MFHRKRRNYEHGIHVKISVLVKRFSPAIDSAEGTTLAVARIAMVTHDTEQGRVLFHQPERSEPKEMRIWTSAAFHALFNPDQLTKRIFSGYDFRRSEDDQSTVKLGYENRGEKLGMARLLPDRGSRGSRRSAPFSE